MIDVAAHIQHLKAAEAQFRVATAARLAVTFKRQPLDLPIQWSHGWHKVSYAEVALDQDEADFGAWNLQRSATFLMASAALEAIKAAFPNPKTNSDAAVVTAYQVSRLVRNAFAHSPFNPVWRIDPDCRDQEFAVPEVIKLDTTGLDNLPFDWRHYGGPLALLRLAQFVRRTLLQDPTPPPDIIPLPERAYYQQGDLILERIPDRAPDAAV